MYEYEKHDDYHNAFDGDKFKRWVVSFFFTCMECYVPWYPPYISIG